MRKIIIAIATITVLCFYSCVNKGTGVNSMSGIETDSCQDTPDTVKIIAQNMYDDIMSKYCSGEDGQTYAFRTYASAKLLKLLDNVDNAITKEEIEPMIYGWDCDPWIMAQDWNHPLAKVKQVYDFSSNSCMADVEISEDMSQLDYDGVTKVSRSYTGNNITIKLVKENGKWKVDDFISQGADDNTFAKRLREDYESEKSRDR